MTHCSVHTMSLQLEPANTVFIPAQERQAANDTVLFVTGTTLMCTAELNTGKDRGRGCGGAVQSRTDFAAEVP